MYKKLTVQITFKKFKSCTPAHTMYDCPVSPAHIRHSNSIYQHLPASGSSCIPAVQYCSTQEQARLSSLTRDKCPTSVHAAQHRLSVQTPGFWDQALDVGNRSLSGWTRRDNRPVTVRWLWLIKYSFAVMLGMAEIHTHTWAWLKYLTNRTHI